MSLINGFLQQCVINPNNLAFAENDHQINYGEFYARIRVIANTLQELGCTGERIAVYLDRGIDAASAIYAILLSSACYIPLDIKNPPERNNFIINDAQPKWLIGSGNCPEWLETPEQWLDLAQVADDADNFTANAIDPNALAAILYTSGSTGAPKGVALSHQAMLNFADWARLTFAITEQDQIASLAPFYFDLSVFDLFSSLAAGASVHFVPAHLSLAPARLVQWLQKQAITCWYTVPSLLSFIAIKGGLGNTPLPNLKTLLFAGEVFPTPLLLKLTEQLPQVNFYNLYGPTETNVCCYWPVERNRLIRDRPIPIGISACQAELKMDEQSGELYVKGINNFSGYWYNGQLQPIDLKNWYATGDKVSLNEQGEYCYHGRLDRMLKCSGFRVEPAEIEHIICQSPLIEECAVIGIKDPASGQRPAAIIVLKASQSLHELIPVLKAKLPHYMFPSKFLVVPGIPRLTNGKIDYSSLPALFDKP